jgi:hypothetical protein
MIADAFRRPTSRRAWLTTVLGGLSAFGCSSRAGEGPVELATNWPLGQLGVLPARLLETIRAAHGYARPPRVSTSGSWAVVGGAADDAPESFAYEVGLWVDPRRYDGSATLDALSDLRLRDRIALDDPTVARGSALWVARELGAGPWGDRYLGLLRAYANARAPRPGLLAAEPRRARGEVDAALGVRPAWIEPSARFVPLARPIHCREAFEADPSSPAVRVVRDALRIDEFEDAPEAADRLASPQKIETRRMASLIRAACVESHAELRAAFDAIDRADVDRPRAAERARYWIAQPPPWPPASVAALRRRRDGDRLVDDLIGHLVADPDTRRDLALAWQRPPQPIDAATLASIRWTDRPVFAEWLAAEWGAWCRQRYRRAARLAAGAGPSS